jgi:hypothetical protein
MVSQRRDVIPKCDSHSNEELLFCETCDKIFCQQCDQHQISAEHTVVPFSLAIKRMNEILAFKASKSKSAGMLPNNLARIHTRTHRLHDDNDQFNDVVVHTFLYAFHQ